MMKFFWVFNPWIGGSVGIGGFLIWYKVCNFSGGGYTIGLSPFLWKFCGSGEYPPKGLPKVALSLKIGCAPLGNLYSPLQFAIPGYEELPRIKVEAVGAIVGGYYDW